MALPETLITAQVDGTTLTAAAAASCIPAAAKVTIPANYFQIGKTLMLFATGRISSAVTTPGTARFDVRFGSTVVFDSLAMNLKLGVLTGPNLKSPVGLQKGSILPQMHQWEV